MTSERRCFVCGARTIRPTDRVLRFASGRRRDFALACASCGLLLDADADFAACRADLDTRLQSASFVSGDNEGYGLDIFTLRIAATARLRGAEPDDEAQRRALMEPHAPIAAEARLSDLRPGEGPGVALGLLCRESELESVLAQLAGHAAWAAEALVLVDAEPRPPAPLDIPGLAPGKARIAFRPLGDDFAAQRNALQAMTQATWMLQLDADETLEEMAGTLLSPLARLGDASGAVSIGLPRLNLVDGIASDLFPDTQYRLNHRSLRYGGTVHERPRRDWRRSFISLHGAIRHHLSRAHVETRSARYEAMEPGRGRLEEAAALLEPYRP